MGIISQVRQEAKHIMSQIDEMYAQGMFQENGRYKNQDYDAIAVLFKNMPGYQEKSGPWSNAYFFPPAEQTEENRWSNRLDNAKEAKYWLEYLEQNRMRVITSLAYARAFRRVFTPDYFMSSASAFSIKLTDNITGNFVSEDGHKSDHLYKALEMLSLIPISIDDLKHGVEDWKQYRSEQDHRLNVIFRNKEASEGLKKLFESAPTVDLDKRAENIKQLNELQTKIVNGLASRTWGFEIEVPDAKGIEAPAGIEKGDDASLRSENTEDCECDCGDCTYHECDCDFCDNGNSDPDHCGDNYCASNVDSAEFRTNGGVQRVKHAGMYQLLKELNDEDAEMNNSAGTHIHVFAADLTTHQVGQVMASYTWLQNILSVVAGRRNVNYAKDVPLRDIGTAIRNRAPKLRPEKALAVNVTWVANGADRGTIEFRQMDCNLNADRITFWAWMMRGFVETAKRGASLKDFRNVKDLQGIVDVFAKFQFTLQSECPEMIIPGTRLDAANVKRQRHLVA